MSENANIIQNVYMQRVNTVRAQFLEAYQEIAKSVSEESFVVIPETLPQLQKAINIDVITREFQDNLKIGLEHQFRQMWNGLDINENLSVLEHLKETAKDKNPQWRPAGKTAEELTRGKRIKFLEKKIDFFQKQLDHQKPFVDKNFQEIELLRKNHKELAAKNEELLLEIRSQTLAVDAAHAEVAELQKDLQEVLKQICS